MKHGRLICYAIGCLMIFINFSVAKAQDDTGYLPDPPEGMVPTVDTYLYEEPTVLWVNDADDGPSLRPNHPPMEEIQPMPMPQPREDQGPQSTSENLGPGVYHNMLTGETIFSDPNDYTASEGLVRGGGFNGSDIGESDPEKFTTTFNDMSLVANTSPHPWRMNVKLVMQFASGYSTCSGSMRDAETVLTAGHCVYDYGGDGWAQNVWVYPGWDGVGGQFNPPPAIINNYGYGHTTTGGLGAGTAWVTSGDLDADVGLIGVTRAVGFLTNWYAWSYGGDCSVHQSRTHNNASYPAESCGGGLHTGSDMYYYYGIIDSCPWNQFQINTDGGCFDAGWGGMSGSPMYYIVDGNRYVNAVASTSDRSTWFRFCRQWDGWVIWTNDTFLPIVRGSTFDLQALDVNAAPTPIKAGEATTTLNHMAVNATNGSDSDTYLMRIYLSSNSIISTGDTLLSTQTLSYSFPAMAAVRVNNVQVTIPESTPVGTRYLGIIYDSATDGDSSNNDTYGWDTAEIYVEAEEIPPSPNPMTWATIPYETSTSSISMVATTASDPSTPITYYHNFYNSPTGGTGGTDSGWQSSVSYTDSGLSANHQYGYQVAARDSEYNQTSYSSVSYEATDIERPIIPVFGAITSSSIQARSSNTPSNLNIGNSGLVIYNTTQGTNSGWKHDNNYWTSSGLSPNTQYAFLAQARNLDQNLTAYSSYGYKRTLAVAPGAGPFSNITGSSIRANWTSNGNPAGTEYYCENITAGTNSSWTTSTTWNSTGLNSGINYCFRVRARNGEGALTSWVSLGCALTYECGNGALEPGEQCDDGNIQNGDCCSSICRYEPAGSDCEDGLYCNGDETCNGSGTCLAGTDIDCNDGISCTDDWCNEAGDNCENEPDDGKCPQNGQFCDGAEVCSAVSGCISTGDPCPPGTSCNEDVDECVDCGNGILEPGEQCDDGNTQNGDCCSSTCRYEPAGSDCEDGLYCNGDETCNGSGLCLPGSDVDCNDGVDCTDDWCNENGDTCENDPNDDNCPDNGLFCDGIESCDAVTGCISSGDPCIPLDCNEDEDICEPPQKCITDCAEDESGALNIVETSGKSGMDVIATVEINASPSDLSSLGFDITFEEADCLTYVEWDNGTCLTSGWTFFDCSQPNPGTVRCGGFNTGGAIPAGTSGCLAEVRFHVDATAGLDQPEEAIRLDLEGLVNDMIPFSTSPGYICGGCSCDVNGSGTVTPQDALCDFQKYLGICPTDCGDCEDICCNVNGDSSCTPADALEVFKEYLGIYPNACTP